MHRLEELVRLHRLGTGFREVARLLRMGPGTERQYRLALEAEGLLAGKPDELPPLELLQAAVQKHLPSPVLPPQQQSAIEAWQPRVEELQARGVGPRAIWERLRVEESTFGGSYWQVKRLCRTIRRSQGVRAEDVAIPVETQPGDVAQVDFGHVGKLLDPATSRLREAWCFVMVLGYSRRMVARVVFDQRIATWLRLHVDAFAELGAVVSTVVPDNLKAAVVRAAFNPDGTSELNRSYRELARHYGFKIDPTPPRAPQKKGKVESGVRYVKRSFFRGREGRPIDEVQLELAAWVRDTAQERIHGTTGRRPREVYEHVERPVMKALPLRPFEPVEWRRATVHQDTHVAFDRRLYSVPWRLIGQLVWVRATASTVCLYTDDTRVATHDRRGPGPRSTVESHLPEHRADLRHRSRGYWEERATRMGQEVGDYIREVFDSDEALSQLRAAQAMVTHLERVPVERARRACLRARHFASYSWAALKKILADGMDLLPLPSEPTTSAPTPASAPRFARKMSELLHSPTPTEVADERA
jgi:transposase